MARNIKPLARNLKSGKSGKNKGMRNNLKDKIHSLTFPTFLNKTERSVKVPRDATR